MMDIIVTILVDVVIYYLLSYPGAVIRWIFLRKKKSLKEILAEDIFVNSAIGLLFLVPLIGGIILLLRN
jgi:hypothetical protein